MDFTTPPNKSRQPAECAYPKQVIYSASARTRWWRANALAMILETVCISATAVVKQNWLCGKASILSTKSHVLLVVKFLTRFRGCRMSWSQALTQFWGSRLFRHILISKTKKIQYGSTCPRCGLTHRAVMKDADTDHHGRTVLTLDFGETACHCGSRPDEGWVQLYIGSPRGYHRDPVTVYRDMSARNAEFAVGGLTRRHPKIDALRYMPLCAMGSMIYRTNDHINKFARFSKVQNVITTGTKIFKSLGKNDGRLATVQ